MKKTFFTICLAVTAALALNATDYTGIIEVTMSGQTNTETCTVTITEQDNGNNLNTLELRVPFMGMNLDLFMYDVPSSTSGDITTYSAERTVQTGLPLLSNLYTIVFARVTDGMMAANLVIPDYGVTMWFNTVGDHFQLPNSDFEAWTANNGEPDRWHGFKTAKGTFASSAANGGKLESSTDVRPGSDGQSSALITAGSVMGFLANGTMTNGQLNAGWLTANDTRNHAEMDKSSNNTDACGEKFYMPIYAKPDAFKAWIKYYQKSPNADYKATVSVKTFDGTYYQEPVDKVYTNLSGSIVGGQIEACDWTEFTFPMDYDSYAANNATTEAIFVTFATNATPGLGTVGDAVYVDDMELVYLGNMTDLRYQGTTINGWNPAVTTYNMEMAAEPNLDDFTATIEGVSAVLTKSMEKNQDGSYRIAISVVSGDLQNATCYIINVTVKSSFKKGDVNNDGKVDISDVTALIDYLLSGIETGVNLSAADVDDSTNVNIADVTALIDMLLSGNHEIL